MKIMTRILNIIMIVATITKCIIFFHDMDLYRVLLNCLIIPILFIISLFKKKISTSSMFIFTLFIFFGYFLGSIMECYARYYYYYDTIIHTLFGFTFSFFALEFLIRMKFDDKKLFVNFIFILSLIALLAGLWETFEFTGDQIFNEDAQRVIITGTMDTMKDMIVAYLGSIMFILMYAYEYTCNKNLIIKRFIGSVKNDFK